MPNPLRNAETDPGRDSHPLSPESVAPHDGAEKELIARCLDGNLETFDRLMEMHETQIYNLAYRMIGNREDAADLTQDAFIRAFHALPRFRGGSAFSTWLYRIATNVCLDHIKKYRRQKSKMTPSQIRTADQEELDLLDELGDSSLDPQEVLDRREQQKAVQSVISTLPEHQRAVLVLYDIQGESYEEVAQILDISIGTVKSRLNRARLALKSRLETLREQL
ncbi:MAG: sigma-70 family RNA polymerase sigma factor [Armatimonadetes bacterium]|nr:sigma-70 family RNA polymerase sigma factor [Armatimonadota bacterium]PIU60557.1 MAG: RNA polymerase subunit sigma-24 [Armatimonadetes bacterium CG07_land_8_20_14_0_80_59_28]PIX44723.1 MAG: RNA polymerase subunit sigma-24 [Armatimonadetes bacterium CG_4_8_14_3_um_filter_58_9]PIY48131.1 MAG: RNA polymerase subunit sigma-24 [Armatimonadetes bacterium CG_4_10_14_3_um_filter_59_10]